MIRLEDMESALKKCLGHKRIYLHNNTHTSRMNKTILVALMAILLAMPAALGNTKETKTEPCKAIYVCDYESGQAVETYHETERLPIASMCKVMTLLLCFEAIERDELSYTEEIQVSENAAGMGGSQVFLQENYRYSVNELMKSVVVCSANDSCVALAERIAGTEAAFVDRMNERIGELGGNDTLFANCTGLPLEPQYSCAKDVALMFRELIKHDRYFEYAKIYFEEFTHPDGRITSMTNTNKLIRKLDGCDGGKTGFTNQAGFCLAATIKRHDTRFLCVVIGAKTSDERFRIVSDCVNCAFASYENKIIAQKNIALNDVCAVRGGTKETITVCPERSLGIFARKGEVLSEITTQIFVAPNIRAPIAQGDKVGEIVLYQNGVEVSRCGLIAMETVEEMSYFDAIKDSARLWN